MKRGTECERGSVSNIDSEKSVGRRDCAWSTHLQAVLWMVVRRWLCITFPLSALGFMYCFKGGVLQENCLCSIFVIARFAGEATFDSGLARVRPCVSVFSLSLLVVTCMLVGVSTFWEVACRLGLVVFVLLPVGVSTLWWNAVLLHAFLVGGSAACCFVFGAVGLFGVAWVLVIVFSCYGTFVVSAQTRGSRLRSVQRGTYSFCCLSLLATGDEGRYDVPLQATCEGKPSWDSSRICCP